MKRNVKRSVKRGGDELHNKWYGVEIEMFGRIWQIKRSTNSYLGTRKKAETVAQEILRRNGNIKVYIVEYTSCSEPVREYGGPMVSPNVSVEFPEWVEDA